MEKLFFYGQMKSLIKYNNTATLYFEMKIFEKCIKFYRQACKIGKENGAQSKFIFKGFERMGPAHKEMGDLKIAKLVFEKAKLFLEKAQKENNISDYEKCLSEIELAMEHCQTKVSQNLQICMEFFSNDGAFSCRVKKKKTHFCL